MNSKRGMNKEIEQKKYIEKYKNLNKKKKRRTDELVVKWMF